MIRKLIVALVVVAAALWYLRDPAWLSGVASGLRPWEQDASGARYRWSGGHASFFVPSDATAVQVPVSTTFERDDVRPMLVTATVDDGTPLRVLLHDDRWYTLTLQLPPRQSRRVRRIDIRTSITRGDNHGVRVGEVQVIRVPVAARLGVVVPAERQRAYPVARIPMPPIPKRMRAIEIAAHGGPEVLRPVERPVPEPGPDEVLIRVAAAGVNRPDVMQRMGKYPPPPGASDIPGLEVSGEIVAVRGDTTWRVAEEVCALVAGGGYAEYCAVPAGQCLRVPAAIPVRDAAAIPETFFTVWTNLFDRGRLRRGERVLIHGGTSGIGTTAIQLARAFGATVFTTAGSDAKCDACRELGASRAINYRAEDFVQIVKGATGGEGVDVILDIIGGDYVARNLECLRLDGRLVQIGLMGGSRTEVDFRLVLQKRLTVTGSTLRARSVAEKTAIAHELEREIWPLLDRGEVAPVIDGEFSLDHAADAHRELEAGNVIGKLVLVP